MKFRALAACATLAIGFAACSDDDDSPDGTDLGGDLGGELDTGSIAVPGTEIVGDTGAAVETTTG
jgi:hypothetical protein